MKLEKTYIIPDPYADYHISQGVTVGDFLFISEQTALNDEGELVGVGDFD